MVTLRGRDREAPPGRDRRPRAAPAARPRRGRAGGARVLRRPQRLPDRAASRSAPPSSSTASSAASASAGRSPIPSCSTRASPTDGMLPVYRLVQGLGQRRLRRLAASRRSTRAAGPARVAAGRPAAGAGLARAGAAAIAAAHRPADGRRPRARMRRPGAASPATSSLASQLALGLMRAARDAPARPGAHGRRHACSSGMLAGPALRADRLPAARHRRDRAATSPARRRCCGCCRAMSAAARPWWRAAAMLRAIEAGAQAALMAPTEVLARQHAATLARAHGAAWASTVDAADRPRAGRRRRAALAGLAVGAGARSPSAPMRCSRTGSSFATWAWS